MRSRIRQHLFLTVTNKGNEGAASSKFSTYAHFFEKLSFRTLGHANMHNDIQKQKQPPHGCSEKTLRVVQLTPENKIIFTKGIATPKDPKHIGDFLLIYITQPTFTWSSSTMETPEQRVKSVQCYWCRSGDFMVNFEQIPHIAVIIVNFEQVLLGKFLKNISKIKLYW